MEDLDFLNEGVYRMGQSAEFVMHQRGIPLFQWADKLVGNNEYSE